MKTTDQRSSRSKRVRIRISLTFAALFSLITVGTAVLIGLLLEDITSRVVLETARGKLNAISALTASRLDLRDARAIDSPQDQGSEEFARLHAVLSKTQQSIFSIRKVFLWRVRSQPGSTADIEVAWIVDGDPLDSPDYEPPGSPYSPSEGHDPELIEAFSSRRHVIDSEPVTDNRGSWLFAYFPLNGDPGSEVSEVLGVSLSVEELSLIEHQVLALLRKAIILAGLVMVPVGLTLGFVVAEPLRRIARISRGLAALQFPADNLDRLPGRWVDEIDQVCDSTQRLSKAMESFTRYLPRDVVRLLLRSNQAASANGDKRVLSLMFTDIRSFTSYAESTSVERLRTRMNDYLTVLSHAIVASDGTVDKFIGDAAMAFWGAPEDVADKAHKACHAALAIRTGTELHNQSWRQQGEAFSFFTRIGLHHGEVIVGNFGSDDRLNYTVFGDNVNLCSRLEGANKSYDTDIIASESMVRAIEAEAGKDGTTTEHSGQPEFVFFLLDRLTVKGKSRPTLIYGLYDRSAVMSAVEIRACAVHSELVEVLLQAGPDEAATRFLSLPPELLGQPLLERLRMRITSQGVHRSQA